jgi:hypothetical protein
LIGFLKSGDAKKQVYAAKAIGNIGKNSKEAIKALVYEFTKKRVMKINEVFECAIVYSLGKIGFIKDSYMIKIYFLKYQKYIEN